VPLLEDMADIFTNIPSHFFANHIFSLYLCTRNIKSSLKSAPTEHDSHGGQDTMWK